MRHAERDSGPGAEPRDTVLRTVIFAFVSLAAWWGCSNVASADEAPPATPPAGDGDGLRAIVEMLGGSGGAPEPATPELRVVNDTEGAEGADPATMGPQEPVVVTDPPEAFVPEPPVVAENGLMAGVVVPLVTAVQPALAPVGELVDPTLSAVTTPLAPLVQTVVPVVDRVAGPVLGPVVTPLVVHVVAPVVEQASTAVAPVVELLAPVIVPVAQPVVALVAPVVGQLTAALAEPVVAVVRPALRVLDDPGPGTRVQGLRPATATFADERGPSLPSTPDLLPGGEQARPTDTERRSDAVRRLGSVRGSEGAVLESPAAAVAAAPASPGGLPFRPAAPGQQPAVMTQSGADTNQRTQRLVAVLSPSPGVPATRLSALSGSPAGSPLARFGGRPPVTPD